MTNCFKYILLTLLFYFIIQQTEAQQLKEYQPLKDFDMDTLKYIETNFINNKAYYINKPLNVLFKEMEVPIRSYGLNFGERSMMIDNLFFSFYSKNESNAKIIENKKPLLINISWQTPINFVGSFSKLNYKYKGEWTKEVQIYFGKQVLKDIYLLKHNK